MGNIGDFLQNLHPREQLGSDYFELRAFNKSEQLLEFFTDYNAAEKWLLEHYQTFDVYCGVCPRPTKRGRNEDIHRSYWLWADVDAAKLGRKGRPLQNLIFSRIALMPTMIVESGSGGLHVYWQITPCADLKQVTAANNLLAERINSDRVGDPARILRVAGTLNHKNTPAPVTLIHYNAALVYTIADIEAALRLTPEMALRIHSGSEDSYPSRSERDFAVCAALVRAGMTDDAIESIFAQRRIGDKADESPNGHYLQFTLKKVRETEGLAEGEISPLFNKNQWGIVEVKGAYYAIGADGALRQLSTFVFEPEELLEGQKNEPDTLVGNVRSGSESWQNFAINRKAFTRSDSLVNALTRAQWQWFGKDSETRRLLPYLMEKLAEKGNGKIVARTGVGTLGRYENYLVLPGQTLDASGMLANKQAPMIWLPTGREHPKVQLKEFSDEETIEAIHDFCDFYFGINDVQVVYAALGWYIAALFKTKFESQGIRFPTLNLFGTRGSGKTTIIKNVLQPLVGYNEPKTYDVNTTNFVILSLLGSSNCIPVSFSEYRRSSLRNPESFLRYILLGYDSGSDSRGRSDQTTVEYPLCAPFTIDGEDAISDPACLERTIQLNLHPETVKEGSLAYENFSALNSVNFRAIAYALLKWSLSYEPDFNTAFTAVHNAYPIVLPDRVRKNMAVVLSGLMAFNQFVFDYTERSLEYNLGDVFDGAIGSVVSETTGRTKLMVDDMIEDVINFIQTSAIEPFVYQYDNETLTLYLQLSSVYRWWVRERVQRRMPVLDLAGVKNQLRERKVAENSVPQPGNYVTYVGTKRISGAATHVYAINLVYAHSTGLDIPERISRFNPIPSVPVVSLKQP